MTYRIKVPAKTLPVDEAHLLSGLEHALLRLQDYRRRSRGQGISPCRCGGGGACCGSVGKLCRMPRARTERSIWTAPPMILRGGGVLKQAIAKYRQVVEQYPRTPTAPVAHCFRQQCAGPSQVWEVRSDTSGFSRCMARTRRCRAGAATAYTYLLKGIVNNCQGPNHHS
jgi:hypothetical protein